MDALLTITISGHGTSPILRRDNSNNETEGKREEVGGATEAHNHMQESQVVNCVAPDDFADCPQNYVGMNDRLHYCMSD